MRYNKLGRTGLFVSELCLGTMTFGGGEGMWRQIGAVQQEEANGLDTVSRLPAEYPGWMLERQSGDRRGQLDQPARG